MSHKTQNMEQKQHTKKEMNSLPKKYEASYVFTDCITRIWPLINDIKNIETIINNRLQRLSEKGLAV